MVDGLSKMILIYFCVVCLYATQAAAVNRTFEVGYKTFLKDGEPYRYISGSIHYSRVPHYYWKDRLMKMKAAGLNTIQMYINWNVHEPKPGKYNFTGQQDVVQFMKIAQDVGLDVVLRAGPYICGEWEMGGIPPWVTKNNASIVLRTIDPQYLAAVDRWLSVLLPTIKPMLHINGGPILMVQVENEYGSYFACDYDYLRHLRLQFINYLGTEALLFTTDGAGENYLKCGTLEGLYSTVDFGPGDAVNYFKPMQKWEPNGPLVNSEYYTGWLDHWGSPHSQRDIPSIVNTLKQMLDLGASVNMYMFEGGTNFGFMNGANGAHPGFQPVPTSYDYDAPLNEAGDPTPKYMAIRDLLAKYNTGPLPPVPPALPKYAYGTVQMKFVSTVVEALHTLSPEPVQYKWPLSMEQVNQNYGFIVYRHLLRKNYTSPTLGCLGVRDRAYVMIDKQPQGIMNGDGPNSLNVSIVAGQTIDIIVENQGRINFGTSINGNWKGLIQNVTMGTEVLEDWEIFPLPLDNINEETLRKLEHSARSSPHLGALKQGGYHGKADTVVLTPSLYKGTFQAPNKPGFLRDTFLNMDGWFKGQAFMNGFNLGRYWPVKGPQVTLYVPSGVLKAYPAENDLVMMELEWAPCAMNNNQIGDDCTVKFIDTPIINSTSIAVSQFGHSP
ncbi:unnamed protein product [Owenia fusiformis]|uniref:Beta-galactosidase n=1 Tax=Owenia fusiformis TaxID=6347 RepID=A0A8J1UX80_OWEFU|nr:unnamed protein product [Owenia fusiformis]